MAKRTGMFKVKRIPLAFCIWALLWSCHSALAGNEPTLSETLKTFFAEESMHIVDQPWAEIDVLGLWRSLGIDPDDSTNKSDGGWDHAKMIGSVDSNSKVIVYYRVHMSGRTTNAHNEYVILELKFPYSFPMKQPWQLLIYRRKGGHWLYEGDVLGRDEWYELEVAFHKTPDKSLLLSVRSTEARGTGYYLGQWTLYKFIDGKITEVLRTYGSSSVTQGGFDGQYRSQLWPTYCAWPDIGMTYYIEYDTHGDYWDLKSAKEITLFGVKKDMLYIWDEKRKMFVFEKASSESSAEGIDAMLHYGPRGFYEGFKSEINELRLSGNKYQKEWAELFERSMEKSSAK
jgi:hypothetical protein